MKRSGQAATRQRERKSITGAKIYRELTQRPLAPLERLPVEILCLIFTLANHEMNLAKASWHLMSCIKSHWIYKVFLAFGSFAATRVSGSESAKLNANPLLDSLPRLSQDERLLLQHQILSGTDLKPLIWLTVQASFFSQLLRARYARLCLGKGYGPLKTRPNRRAAWEATRCRYITHLASMEISTTYYDKSSRVSGLLRFHPDPKKDVVEVYDFPAVEEQQGNFQKAPFPDKWYLDCVGKSRGEKTMIASIVLKRYQPRIPSPSIKGNPRNGEVDFNSFMLLAATHERRTDILASNEIQQRGD